MQKAQDWATEWVLGKGMARRSGPPPQRGQVLPPTPGQSHPLSLSRAQLIGGLGIPPLLPATPQGKSPHLKAGTHPPLPAPSCVLPSTWLVCPQPSPRSGLEQGDIWGHLWSYAATQRASSGTAERSPALHTSLSPPFDFHPVIPDSHVIQKEKLKHQETLGKVHGKGGLGLGLEPSLRGGEHWATSGTGAPR